MQEVFIDSLQKQVRTSRDESWEVCVFLWGGWRPPHACDLYRCPSWGISVPVPLLVSLLVLCLVPILFSLPGVMALSLSVSSSVRGGLWLLSPASPFPLFPHPHSIPFFIYLPVPWLFQCVESVLLLPWFGHYVGHPRREVNDPSHDGSDLLLWCPPPP